MQINQRSYTLHQPIETELNFSADKNYLFDLSYLGVIDVIGERALEFLQGQLTADMNQISDIQMIQSAQCNLKGRVMACMDVLNWQGIRMVLPHDLLEATIESLNKTAMLSRVALKKNTDLVVLGLYLQNPDDILPESGFFPHELHALTFASAYCCYHIGHGFYLYVATRDFAQSVLDKYQHAGQMLGSLTWHTLRLRQGQFEIYPESRGLFLPHRLGLHQTTYLSFNKGCYKGQEIIARMHYKATLKHEMKVFEIESDEIPISGQMLPITGKEVEVVDVSCLGETKYLVVGIVGKGDY